MTRVFLIYAGLGVSIAFGLLALSICCFDYLPWARKLYGMLWPTTWLLDSVVDPVRPSRSDFLIFLAAAANGLPYGMVGLAVTVALRRLGFSGTRRTRYH